VQSPYELAGTSAGTSRNSRANRLRGGPRDQAGHTLRKQTPNAKAMPIPKFNGNGVLPPQDGDPANLNAGSPYPATTLELCQTFGKTAHRRAILKGFLALRAALRQLQITNGFQWVDGHFLEQDHPKNRRPPDHIQVVTFFHPNETMEAPEHAALAAILRNRKKTRQQFRVDHMPVLLSWPPELVIEHTRHWCTLLSHQRETGIWKGLLKINLDTASDDSAALEHLQSQEEA